MDAWLLYRIWAFGDNLAGQCGIPVEDARQVVPKRIKLSSDNYHALHVSCGTQHSGCITSKHQLYLWGNSSGHKLIFTHIQDKILSQDELPGVSIRSGNKSRCMNAMLVYNLLHEMVSSFCLGDDCTIVITGNGVLQENKRTR
ncbi:regulator of chromosome condensation (RCC1) repeat-containing protein [Cardiosporidium cionae]|uniref:Regulator of chromosome condensation (RCC1) repeat-containing protein n=1 Tax=Cardiosporidium cionae TaxID=476202 RepID=A0ABQ7J9Q9_9APIC|nr:regulator of chromosome condensation (RCC1) repeat-containing protein [Cardiosporidium cionae]|eukprot:KAF8820696.1 regulator of chromosome condensation (RCC1) repeat-containing protein [Cardiosporidium cionae]